MVEISTPIEFADRAVYLPSADALVCADLHLGRDDAAPVELPLGERTRLPDRIDALLDRFNPAELVLAGDIVHAFEDIPAHVEDTLGGLIDAADAAGARPVLLEGNHDAILSSIAPLQPTSAHRLQDGTLVVHGHESPPEVDDITRIVFGHVHPAIVIEGRRRPCYLYDDHATPTRLVLPAFNSLAPGTPLNDAQRSDLPSPLLDRATSVRPIVRDPDADETLWFPPLASFREML